MLVAGGNPDANVYTATAELFSNSELGDGCALATDCQSGFCADGVCCDSACGAANDCQMCNAPGSVGTCVLAPAATGCRASISACDAPEVCDGMNAACPADAVLPAGTACRPAVGPCDIPEICDGMNVVCPVDSFAPMGTSCRAAAGPCDIEELCNGTSTQCPAEGFLPVGTVCRAATNAYDVAETCTGIVANCPGDSLQVDGVLCDDGNPCSLVDSCKNGQCAPGAPLDCTAKDECQLDGACNLATGQCVAPPPKADGTPCAGGTCQGGICTPAMSSSGVGGSAGAGGSIGEGGSGGTASGSGGGQTTPAEGCDCRLAGASEPKRTPGFLLGVTLLAARRMRRRKH